jgi:NADH-ubiquinone oxidoreductase chain 3
MTSTTFFFVFIPLLAIILLAINLIFAPHNPYEEKDTPFECGFHSFLGQNRTQFSISFFIFALLFLLFDLEILLVYPYVVSAYTNGIYGLIIMLIFFLALTLGFAFELGKNALKIDSRQNLTLNSKTQTTVFYLYSGKRSIDKPKNLTYYGLEVNMDSILFLDIEIKKLISILKYKKNKEIDPYSLFYTIHKWDGESSLYKEFPMLYVILETTSGIFDERANIYELMQKSLDVLDIHVWIKEHNKLVIPVIKSITKTKVLENLNLITPGFTGNPFSTPLSTVFPNSEWDKGPADIIPGIFYQGWIMSSYYMIYEYNILTKAKVYLENKCLSNPKELSLDYFDAFVHWQLRQFEISSFQPINIEKTFYIKDYTIDSVMYREICEDLLYVQLNLILAINMSLYLNKYKEDLNESNKPEFITDIMDILSKHITKHQAGYNSLQLIRENSINKLGQAELKSVNSTIEKDLNIKNLRISELRKLLTK